MNEFPMHKMNSSDEDILDISHAGGSGNASLTSDGATNSSEGRPRDGECLAEHLPSEMTCCRMCRRNG